MILCGAAVYVLFAAILTAWAQMGNAARWQIARAAMVMLWFFWLALTVMMIFSAPSVIGN